MKYFDLHCDTLTRISEENPPQGEELHVTEGKAKIFEEYYQVFAFFTDDTLPLSGAKQRLNRAMKDYGSQAGIHPLFAIEGGGVLEDDLKNLPEILRFRPCFFSLCWNGKNAFACGNMSDPSRGLTRKGKKLVRLLEENHIFADVSHLSDKGFDDLAKTAKRPFVATHSNARAVCPHPRNCTDRQLQEIFERKGLCGLNFYPPFVGENPEDILRHIDRMLSLGGETAVAVGGDWDGCDPFDGIDGIAGVPYFYEMTKTNFGREIADKFFFDNAYSFFRRHSLLPPEQN